VVDTDAVALFGEAVHLWRGTPFTDLDTPWLARMRTALEAELHAAQLDRTDAALRCGQHTRLLAELRSQAAEQPFDEPVAGQWILAGGGAGRAAEALAAYQGTRQALIDHLGIEPGPDLRRLHERILVGDIALAAPAAVPPQPVTPVPYQLPAAARHFTGR